MSSSASILCSTNTELKGNDFILETELTATLENNGSATNKILGKELQSALRPINMMQAVFFCAKYKIRDNVITTNSVFYNMVSVFAMFVVTGCCYYFTFESTTFDEKGFKYYQYLVKIYFFFLVFVGTFLNCCTSIIQRHNNVLFVLRIQAVDTMLKIGEIFKRTIFPNWVCVIALNCYHIAWVVFSHLIIDFVGLKLVAFSFTTHVWLSFDMNVLYATRIMKLLTESLISWVRNVKISERIENSEKDGYWKTMFEVYMEIFEAYKIFGKTFHHLILFYIMMTTSKSLICIAMRIEMKKVTTGSDSYFALVSFISLTWIIKNMLLLIFLSVECERFVSAMREVQSACIKLANSKSCSDTQIRICKNIQRVQKTSFKKMHACGLFIIDAALSLHLCALITTYTIVILQFEFL